MQIEGLFKKTKTYKVLQSDVAAQKTAHAYLLDCADGELLRNFLLLSATVIFKFKPSDREYKLILDEKYSDLIIYPNAQQPTLNVAVSQEIIEKSQLKPLENNIKVIVIDKAHDLNTAAQNKLLKILEQPPQNTFFLLGTNNIDMLLATVKSRLTKLTISGFDENDISKFLIAQGVELQTAQMAAIFSFGSLGKAQKLAAEPSFMQEINYAFDIVTGKLTLENSADYAQKIENSNKTLPDFLSILQFLFKEMLKIKLNGGNVVNNIITDKLAKNSCAYHSGAIIEIIEYITQTQKELHFNANVAMQAHKLVLEMLKGKHKWQKL